MNLDTLLERRDDPREWAVYADWLQTRGDPRGPLASLMLSRETSASPALAEAVRAQEQLLRELTPLPLKTLGTRGYPRLGPVFRRGFITSAGAAERTDFEALLEHPSCALLDRALLWPEDVEELDRWLALVKRPLPWRSLELRVESGRAPTTWRGTDEVRTGPVGDDELPLPRLFELAPRLESLTLRRFPSRVSWEGAERLRALRIDGATRELLAPLARHPALRRLELRTGINEYGQPNEAENLEALVAAVAPLWPRLEEVVLEGTPGPETRQLFSASRRPARAVVRAPRQVSEAFCVPLTNEPETSFDLFSRPLGAADEAALVEFARLAGVTRLMTYARELQLGPRMVSVVRLHGVGDAPLVARVAAQQLARRDRTLDALALSLSSELDTTSAWSFGPHVRRPDLEKNVLPTARREEGRYTRAAVTREVSDALLGFDPGLDLLEELLLALDLASPKALLGDAPQPGEQVPLFTTSAPCPSPRMAWTARKATRTRTTTSSTGARSTTTTRTGGSRTRGARRPSTSPTLAPRSRPSRRRPRSSQGPLRPRPRAAPRWSRPRREGRSSTTTPPTTSTPRLLTPPRPTPRRCGPRGRWTSPSITAAGWATPSPSTRASSTRCRKRTSPAVRSRSMSSRPASSAADGVSRGARVHLRAVHAALGPLRPGAARAALSAHGPTARSALPSKRQGASPSHGTSRAPQ